MNWFKLFSISAVMVLLTACSSDDAATGGPIIVTAESGEKVDITGTWKSACYFNGDTSIYQIDVHTYTAAGVWSNTVESYGGDATCSTIVSTTTTHTSTNYVVGADTILTGGWVDGGGNADVAPNSQAGPTLSSTPTVSKVVITLDSDYKDAILVDDSVSTQHVIYRGYDRAALDSEGYPTLAETADPLFKQ